VSLFGRHPELCGRVRKGQQTDLRRACIGWCSDRRVWIVGAHQRRRRWVTEVSGLNPVQGCSGLASRWRACGYGLKGQEISDAEESQYLSFHRADAAARLVVIQAR
jgi:hypothetical protein